MKIYTKTGDDGTTGLFGGRRVSKTDLRVETYGAVDELNAVLGLAVAGGDEAGLSAILSRLQRELFVLGADLATPRGEESSYLPRVEAAHVEALEKLIDDYDARLSPLKNFILPGGSPTSARLHHARTVCRRAERAAVALAAREPVGAVPVTYLNRMADLLFVLARWANRAAGVPEVEWAPRKE